MNYENISIENLEYVKIVTISRPKVLNALNLQTLHELYDYFTLLNQEKNQLMVIITGSGEKAFVAGADISEMALYSPIQAKQFSHTGHHLMTLIENSPFFVIGAVNGYALGGGMELALACDLLIASENAQFGQPEINLGVVPGFGGLVRLPKKVGFNKAKEIIALGKNILADEAQRLGLCNKVVPQNELISQTIKIAEELSKKPFLALKTIKETLNTYDDIPHSHALSLEQEKFALLFDSSDQKEGMKAFIEKRKPQFANK